MTPLSYSQSTPSQAVYQANWPVELIDQFYKKANGDQAKALKNLVDYAKPYYVAPIFESIPDLGSRFVYNANFLTPWFIWVPQRNPYALSTRQNILNFLPKSESISVKTPDGFNLKGMLVPGQLTTNKIILFCNPNESSMESMSGQFLDIGIRTGCTSLIFNQRGIEESEGQMTPDGYILDVYTMFEYLVNQRGISPSDIVIYGRSMGGGYGAEAAAMVQRKYPWAKINFVSERSFSKLSTEIHCFGPYVPVLGPIVCRIATYASLTRNIFDAKTAAESLKGRVCIIFHKNDPLILHRPVLGFFGGGSLNEEFHLENASCQELFRIELKNNDPTRPSYYTSTWKNITHCENHNRSLEDHELRAVVITLRRMLNIQEEFDFPTPDYVKQMIDRESKYWA